MHTSLEVDPLDGVSIGEQTSGECRVCPEGAACEAEGTTLAALDVNKGYYRFDDEAVVIYPCPWGSSACNGANGDSSAGGGTCAEGYEGHLCQSCQRDFYENGYAKTCEKCRPASPWWVYALVLASCAGLAWPAYKLHKLIKSYLLEMGLIDGETGATQEHGDVGSWEKVQDNCKTIFYTWQVGSALSY